MRVKAFRKRVFAGVLAAVIGMQLCACGKDDDSSSGSVGGGRTNNDRTSSGLFDFSDDDKTEERTTGSGSKTDVDDTDFTEAASGDGSGQESSLGFDEAKAGITDYVCYNNKNIPIEGIAYAEEAFMGEYMASSDFNSSSISMDADVRNKIGYKVFNELGEKEVSELPLTIDFGRGFGALGGAGHLDEKMSDEQLEKEHVSMIEKYGNEEGERYYQNYIILDSTYMAKLKFLEKDTEKTKSQFCVYDVSGDVIRFRGVNIKDDLSLEYTGFVIELKYGFEGINLVISNGRSDVVLQPKEILSESYDFGTLIGEPYDYSCSIEHIISLSCFTYMDKKCYMFFDDGCSTSECDINYKEDGTFSVVGTAEKKNKDGQVDHVHSINLSGNYIGGGNYYGYTLIVDDKAYIYTEHNAYRDDNLSDSQNAIIVERESTAAERLKEALNGMDVQVDEHTGEVTFDGGLLFAFDSSELEDAGKNSLSAFLDKYTGVIMELKNEGLIDGIEILGYTDSQGSYSYNMELSQKRAESVYALVNESKPELGEICSAKGMGSNNLIMNQDHTINDEKSRRVTFCLIISKN